MNWINNLLNKIKPADNEPLTITTKIERPSGFQELMEKEAGQVKLFLTELRSCYQQGDLENFRSSGSLAANSQYACGLVINKTSETSEDTFMCVFETLKNNTKILNYRLNYQTCEVKIGKEQEERKEIYYLKPHFSYADNNRYEQRFGNVKIERNLVNGVAQNITLLCTYYSGYNYSNPIPFAEFIAVVCDTP